MTGGWSFGGEPAATGSGVTLVEGSSFCVCDASGGISAGTPEGLFFLDTRILSGWDLTVDGASTGLLGVFPAEPWCATFVSRVMAGPGRSDSSLLVRRERYVGQGMREDITVENLTGEAAAVQLRLRLDADFADLFEVKES